MEIKIKKKALLNSLIKEVVQEELFNFFQEEAISPSKAANTGVAFTKIESGNYIRGYLYKTLKDPKIIAFAEMSFDSKNPYDSYVLERTAAEKGYGPLIYDIMLSIADKKDRPVSPDRYSVSKYAKNVWDYYFSKRKDVSHLPIDDEKNPLTRDKKDDGEVHYSIKDGDLSKRKPIDFVYFIDKPINYRELINNHKEWIANSSISQSEFNQIMKHKGEQFFHQMYGRNY